MEPSGKLGKPENWYLPSTPPQFGVNQGTPQEISEEGLVENTKIHPWLDNLDVIY